MSNKHICKELDRMLDKISKMGFRINRGNGKIKIYPPDKEKEMYVGHEGERAFHPIRRYIKNVCGIEL